MSASPGLDSTAPLIEAVRDAWGWCGINPVAIVGENEFGNLMVKDDLGRYWRLCPEDLYCRVIAQDRGELDAVSVDQEFLSDWYMSALVDAAFEKLGVLPEGRKYCLKIPGVLGGDYGGDNLTTIDLEQLVRASGHLAQQVKDLPPGAQVQLKLVD